MLDCIDLEKEYLKPVSTKYLLDSDYLKVIYFEGRSGNLVLSTHVKLNTVTNEADVSYSVHSWNDNHKSLSKSFKVYFEAHAYYLEIYTQYKKRS